MTDEPTDPQTYVIIGAGMEVHRELGNGFLEAVYREAFCRELTSRGVRFVLEVALSVFFKGEPLSTSFRADMISYGDIVVELKAVRKLGPPELGQAVNYLKASGCSRGYC